MREFTVSVSDILGRPGRYRDVRVVAPLPGVTTSLARLGPRPVALEGRAEAVLEGVLLTGRVAAQGLYTCARCLRGLEAPLELEVCELFVGPGHEAQPEEEFYEIVGEQIELEAMLRDAIALALPLNPVCSEECKGLCPRCGQDLNQAACDCKEEDSDPRWAPLEALKERLESQGAASNDRT